MYKIRDAFSLMVRDKDFSDLFGDVVGSEGWPMIHVDDAPAYNIAFKRGVMRQRKLDAEGRLDPIIQRGESCFRVIYKYAWGAAMYLFFEVERRTVVIEGDRINYDSGGVHSHTRGVQEQIVNYVPWYLKLVKRLKESDGE